LEIFENFRVFDIIDIVLVATLLYYVYKLVKGTVAINIFIGIVVIYLIWQLTVLLKMEMLSTILGQFIGVGMFALIVVFQQEIRKFLLMIGSANLARGKGVFKSFQFSKNDQILDIDVNAILDACVNMGKVRSGALIIIRRTTSLEFVKATGDAMSIAVNRPIIESVFYKNATLHDGAMIIENNTITATRVILPVTQEKIPLRFGLRHRAAIGITEKTDALALVVSEESGEISYVKNGEFVRYKTIDELRELITSDLS